MLGTHSTMEVCPQRQAKSISQFQSCRLKFHFWKPCMWFQRICPYSSGGTRLWRNRDNNPTQKRGCSDFRPVHSTHALKLQSQWKLTTRANSWQLLVCFILWQGPDSVAQVGLELSMWSSLLQTQQSWCSSLRKYLHHHALGIWNITFIRYEWRVFFFFFFLSLGLVLLSWIFHGLLFNCNEVQ